MQESNKSGDSEQYPDGDSTSRRNQEGAVGEAKDDNFAAPNGPRRDSDFVERATIPTEIASCCASESCRFPQLWLQFVERCENIGGI